MQTFLSVKKVRHSHSNHSGAHVKLGQACSMVRKDRESGFHDCGVAEYRVQACLSSGRSDKPISTTIQDL